MKTAIKQRLYSYVDYVRQLSSLYKRCWKDQGKSFSKVLFLGISGAVSLITAFVVIVLYTENIGGVLVFNNIEISSTGSLYELSAIIAIFFILLSASFVAQYRSLAGGLSLAVEYEKIAIIHFFRTRDNVAKLAKFSDLQEEPIMRLVRGDTRGASRILRVSTTLLMPSLSSLFAFFYLYTVLVFFFYSIYIRHHKNKYVCAFVYTLHK